MASSLQALIWAQQQLDVFDPTEAQRDALFLLAEITQKSTATLRLGDVELSDTQYTQFQNWINLRKTHKPVSQIIGFQPFWKWDFYVNEHVLTPRADSECLIESALNDWKNTSKPLKLLDLGTGSGCLLLSLLSELSNVEVAVGVDISKKALETAKKNEDFLRQQGANLPDITWLLGTWDAANSYPAFDVILANPPYIGTQEKPSLSPDVLHFEPKQALFADEEGYAAYNEIFPLLHHLLAPNGKAYIEHGYQQQKQLIAKANDVHLHIEQTLCDDGGNPRGLVITT